MKKELKIVLYIILILAIIAVIWLMLGTTNPNIEELDFDNEPTTGDIIEITDTEEVNNNEYNNTFEEDVMKDLEGFFNTNEGYENVEGEYGFINAN